MHCRVVPEGFMAVTGGLRVVSGNLKEFQGVPRVSGDFSGVLRGISFKDPKVR